MAPSADEQPFLEAILLRPADDAPRLVYADFLDTRDGPADRARADLIRVQCALARLMPEHPRRPDLAERQEELRERHMGEWSAHLAGLGATVEFRRGLPDVVALDAATFLARGDELFRLTAVPTASGTALSVVRRVKLHGCADLIGPLAASPHLARVPELDLCGNVLENGGLHLLLRSPHLGRLERLDLSFNNLDDRALALLARGTGLRNLRSLHLNDNDGVGGAGVARLAESPAVAAVHTLDLSGCSVDETGVRAVLGSRFLTRLHTLALFGNPIGDEGAAALAGSPLLGRMLDREPRLDLRRNEIGPAGAEALAASPALDRVVALDLTGNHLADAGAAAVAGCERLAKLRTLRLGQNQIGDDGADALARSPLMTRLKHLDLSDNRIRQRGVERLRAARHGAEPVLELKNNLHSSDGSSPQDPLTHAPVVDAVLSGLADLRRRVAHPMHLPQARPNARRPRE